VVVQPTPAIAIQNWEQELEAPQADIPITVAPATPVQMATPVEMATPVAPTWPANPEPRTETTRAKVRMVVTSPAAPHQVGSNGFVAGLSYLEDQDQKEFYRRRGIITGAVLIIMVIVIWWALGRTGGAIGDFVEGIIGLLDI
jgi:hypothetical protein